MQTETKYVHVFMVCRADSPRAARKNVEQATKALGNPSGGWAGGRWQNLRKNPSGGRQSPIITRGSCMPAGTGSGCTSARRNKTGIKTLQKIQTGCDTHGNFIHFHTMVKVHCTKVQLMIASFFSSVPVYCTLHVARQHIR